ncbi:MAG: endonuclease/exonuclease/phosphatase family protein [Myxococcota bacterium]
MRPWGIAGTIVLAGCALSDPQLSEDDDAGGTSAAATTGASDDDGLGTQGSGGSEGCDDGCDGSTGAVLPPQEPETECDDGLDDDGDGAVDCEDGDCAEACGDVTLRVATWNILRVGPEGSASFNALASIVRRIDADVLCLQEVGEGEEGPLQALAEAGGYGHGLLAPASGPEGSGIANACMSKTPVVDAAYLWSNWISEDDDARDLTRPFVRIRMQVPGTSRFVSIVTSHLKAGQDDVDRFRRMVESFRLGQVALGEFDEYPNNAVVITGDLNEGASPPAVTFDALPPGLPSFYELGSDISLPFDYVPSQPLIDAGLQRVEARWEDSTADETFIPFGSRLDYVYVGGAQVVGSEVYEACQDDGAGGIDKVGEALDCGISEEASDHRPVVVDLRFSP